MSGWKRSELTKLMVSMLSKTSGDLKRIVTDFENVFNSSSGRVCELLVSLHLLHLATEYGDLLNF